jgi:hypothetical protein
MKTLMSCKTFNQAMDALYKADKDHNYYENVLAAEFKKNEFLLHPAFGTFYFVPAAQTNTKAKKSQICQRTFCNFGQWKR